MGWFSRLKTWVATHKLLIVVVVMVLSGTLAVSTAYGIMNHQPKIIIPTPTPTPDTHTPTFTPSANQTQGPPGTYIPPESSVTPSLTPSPTPAPTKADSLTTVTPSTFNVSRGFTMTVSNSVNSATFSSKVPTGMVTYLIDGNQVGQSPVDSGIGITAATTTGLSVGTHTLTAVYAGDVNFNPSQGSVSFDVNNGV